MTNENILQQVQELLDGSGDGLRNALIKEMLIGVLRLSSTSLDTLDIKILHRALKELRYAFRVFQPYRQHPKVSVFGSARTAPDDPNYQLALRFAQKLVEHEFMVITGGADGIMRAAQEGAGRRNSFGVNILLPFEQGANSVIANDPKLVNFKYFFTRKLLFIKESNAVALFPGGFGTHDEGFEILTLTQTGKSDPKPIVCLHAPGDGYWHQWRDFILKQLLGNRLIGEEDLSLFKIVESEAEGLEEITTFYRRYHSIRFVKKHLVMRLKDPLSEDQLELLKSEFDDLLDEGGFTQCEWLPVESDEPAFQTLPRLVFRYNRRSAGRLRQLIDRINRFPASSSQPVLPRFHAA
jgi:uncharacterized protein (TIGR00730 family)